MSDIPADADGLDAEVAHEVDAEAADARDDDLAAAVGDEPRNNSRAYAVLDYLARSVTDSPEDVQIDTSRARSGIRLSLQVAQEDMGRVIGRRGRIAQAIRTVVRAAGASEGNDVTVDIVD
ncbi:MAG: KH domain-containing protein [Acidimicrobiales bacterium]